MKLNVTQRQIILFMLSIQCIGTLVLLLMVIALPGPNRASELLVGGTFLIFGSMLVAFWRGWEPARYVVVVAITLLVALTVDDPSTGSIPPITLALPPLLALVLTGPGWVIGSGLLQLVILLIRSAGAVVYLNPAVLVVYAMIIAGPLLSRLISDSRQREIEAARLVTSQHLQELADKGDALHVQARLLEEVEQPVITLDASGSITYWNQQAQTLYGWTAEQALGQPIGDMIRFEHPDGGDLGLVHHLNDGWSGEVLVYKRDNAARPALLSLSPLRDSGGTPIGGVVVATDISERKQAERALQQAYDRLETRVEERTAELAAANQVLRTEISERERVEASLRESETQLRLAIHEAGRANAAKNEFLSRMSHELRTPLNAILGFAQLLEMDHLPQDQGESVEQILKGGKHLLAMIDEVLDISRLEAGRLGVSLEPVEVAQVVHECIDMMRPLATRHKLSLDARLDQAPDVYVLADRQRLKQVLVNLLANAIKYNNVGGTVTLFMPATTTGQVRIAIQDTGIGVAPDKLDRLFIPFDRLGAEQTSIEGTGLGLALSKRLITLMGGTIGVESVYRQGSTFWIELPEVESPSVDLNRSLPGATDAAHLDGPDQDGPTHTVLYIEDNLSNLRLFQRILARRPYVALVTAMQGRLGLELAHAHVPDLIYLDLHLPDISGQEVLAHLQSDPRTHDIPVVIVSADATPRQIERLLAAGARAYLTKPLDVRQLFDVLDSTLLPRGQS